MLSSLIFTVLSQFVLLQSDAPIAVITATSAGQPIQEETDGTNNRTITIALGQQIKLSSDKSVHAGSSGSLLWIVEPATTQTELFPNGESVILTGPTTPIIIVVQQIVTSADKIAWQKLRIICGKGAQPPPDPVPVPVPVESRLLQLTLISDAPKALPEEIAIRNSIAFWNELKLKGHDWIFYQSTTPEVSGKALAEAMKAAGIPSPALVLQDKTTKTVITIIPLPKNLSGIEDAIKKVGGK